MAPEEDDFFGTQELDDATRRAHEWNALRRQHVKAGYREGSERGHDAEMQEGFDAGFLSGAKATADAGYWLGVSAVIEAFYSSKKGVKGRLERGDSEVVQRDIQAVKEASTLLEQAVEGVTDAGPELDSSALKNACEKIVILEQNPKEAPNGASSVTG